MTDMPEHAFLEALKQCNTEIASDYYAKHRLKRVLRVIGLDHLRLDLFFKNFTLKQIKPITEALLWAMLGKRGGFLGKYVNQFIYKRKNSSIKIKKNTYWKTFLGIPKYKVDWYFKYFLYKLFGFTFGKLKDQREYWNTRGVEYYKEFFETEYARCEIFFQDLLIDELAALDFDSFFEAGCGFGWNVKRVKKEFPHVRVGGLDFSAAQLENSKLYLPEIEVSFSLGDACSMPFSDNFFDIGFTMGVYMNIHPSKIDRAVHELLRVSRKYIIHLEWDQDNAVDELRERRLFKTNIVSHDYKNLYEKRGKRVIKFATYKDFGQKFYELFPSTKVKSWEQFEGPSKYILIIVEA